MNPYIKHGAKVVFAYPNRSGEGDQIKARKYLIVNAIYTVDRTDMAKGLIFLQEKPNIAFSWLLFEDYKI